MEGHTLAPGRPHTFTQAEFRADPGAVVAASEAGDVDVVDASGAVRFTVEQPWQAEQPAHAPRPPGISPLAEEALDALDQARADLLCSSQTAEDEAARFDEAKRAESLVHLAQLHAGPMPRGGEPSGPMSCTGQSIVGQAGRIVRLVPSQHPDYVAKVAAKFKKPVDLALIADVLAFLEDLSREARQAQPKAGG